MRGWTTKEAKLVMDWARTPAEARCPVDEIARRLGRSIGSVQQFLRRVLPRGQWPWAERLRWAPEEIAAAQEHTAALPTRSTAAVKKYLSRRARCTSDHGRLHEELERQSLTVTQVAADLGVSRASVYRLLDRGVLRRFKGGIAETSFGDLLREHPEVVQYSRLPHDHREWLVLNGYDDPSLTVKRPSVRGLLD
jgi:transposase